MEKQQELFKEWFKNLDDSYNQIILSLNSESISLLNKAFKEGYQKGYQDKLEFSYEEWNQK
jgi:hypothetical protein